MPRFIQVPCVETEYDASTSLKLIDISAIISIEEIVKDPPDDNEDVEEELEAEGLEAVDEAEFEHTNIHLVDDRVILARIPYVELRNLVVKE
jgi:hypothetical protein